MLVHPGLLNDRYVSRRWRYAMLNDGTRWYADRKDELARADGEGRAASNGVRLIATASVRAAAALVAPQPASAEFEDSEGGAPIAAEATIGGSRIGRSFGGLRPVFGRGDELTIYSSERQAFVQYGQMARVRAAVRRAARAGDEAIVVTDHFTVDLAAKQLRATGGETVRLTPTE